MAKKPKPRRMRTSLRQASKVQERGLTETAERLAAKPSLAVPRCEGHGDHFAKGRKQIARIAEQRDDEDALAKAARGTFTHPWARAYAATLLVGLFNPEGVVLQNVKTPFGIAPIVVRGKAKPKHLVGMQHHEDRKLRLYIVLDMVQRKGLTFYAMPDGGIVCAGREGRPPPAFVAAESGELGLLQDPQGWGCPHAAQQGEKLVLRWRAAGVSLRRCAACAEGNALLHIVQHIGARKLLESFDVEVELEPLQGAPKDAAERVPIDPAALERYRKGELDDQGLLAAQRAARRAQLRGMQGPLWVHDLRVHEDADAFIASLKPTPLEAQALRGALQGWEKPVVVERGTPSKVLGELWKERGLQALEAVAGSPEVARAIFERHDVAAKGVGPALQQAQAQGSRRATDAALPTYRALPPTARLADEVARAHRAHGKAAALALLDRDAGMAKPAAHALELALGQAGREWKYTRLELDIAAQLKPLAARVLAAKPEEYHDALEALARAAGETGELRRA